ncbi:MAG: marine proteobacterial sortase target protein [Rhizobiales bacterium]|nr:marine proteobacterial sortase target protein [Hyphomicrobiales bacterium]
MLRLISAFLAFLGLAVPAFATGFATPDGAGTGTLLFQSSDIGRFVEAPRIATDFDIDVAGPVVRTRLTQQFQNPTDGWVEGTYVFPLPESAAVDTLRMVVGERVIIGDIKEKVEAKEIYEQAKAAGQKTALLEQERPNMFTNQVANIGPHETIVIQIEYQMPVAQSGGVYSLRVPTVVGPRYNPPPKLVASNDDDGMILVSDPVPDRDRISPPVLDPRKHLPVNPLTITVHLDAGFAIGAVKSSYHDVTADKLAADREVVRLANGNFADRDFELTWTAMPGAAPSVGLFRETVAGSDYGLAIVSPPDAAKSERHIPREVIFVIDNSGSMGGQSILQAKASLQYALGRLDPSDRFNVIRFDDTMDVMFPDVVPATPGNIANAKYGVGRLDAAGGTEMVPPMRAALADRNPGDTSTLRQVVFLTDGAIGNETEMFDVVSRLRGRSRVFMVGIGSAPNSYLMSRIAELGRGTFTQIGDGSQVEERMRALVDKLDNPVLTDLRASFTGDGVEATPAELPDLYRGEPVVILMKAPKLAGKVILTGTIAGKVILTGTIAGKPWTETVDLAQAGEGSGIAKLWARRKIDDAEVAQSTGRIPSAEADRRILTLALEHHLVSRMTSLVAVDRTPVRPAGEPLRKSDIPINLPAGWDFDNVFGSEPVLEKDAMLDAKLIAVSATRPSLAGTPKPMVKLPQTATFSELFLLLGALLTAMAAALLVFARRMRLA